MFAIWSAVAAVLACPPGSSASGPTGQAGGPRALAELEPRYRASVLRGWRTFQTSFAEDGVACVHCHPRHEEMRSWAGAYPKVQTFDGRPYGVKGLWQVTGDVLETHTDLPEDRRADLVEDLVAYMAWWGDGAQVSPGRSRSVSPPGSDLAELQASVERGRALFETGPTGPCNRCHRAGPRIGDETHSSVVDAATCFPRYDTEAGEVLCLESFLSSHMEFQTGRLHAPESGTITDLAAYLMHLAEGLPLTPGGRDGE